MEAVTPLSGISIRWQILFFFCLLGLIPQVLLSYFSADAYTRSLEETSNQQVSQLVRQAAEQTATTWRNLTKDLTDQASQPYIQLSFQQYPLDTRRKLLQERLALFAASQGVYTRIALCFINGAPLVGSPSLVEDPRIDFERECLDREGPDTAFEKLYAPTRELALFVPVNSFRHPSRVVGFLVAYLPLDHLTGFLERLNLGLDAQKSVLTAQGDIMAAFGPKDVKKAARTRTFSSPVSPLGWQIQVRIQEEVLFRDVIRLKHRSMALIGTVIFLVFVFGFVLSKRFTGPFRQIVKGTRIFAKGNLSHQIQVESGREARQLAAAFNDMASQLNHRQAELNQAVRLASLGVMTAGLGHEIKNPLTGIRTSAQVIKRIIPTPTDTPAGEEELDQVRELAQGIVKEADRLTRILNDLLDFGRPRESQRIGFDISATVAHAAALVKPEFEKKGASLHIRVAGQRVMADPDQILQVLLNLVLNSLAEISQNTGEVWISDNTREGRVCLEIRDNGPGIEADKLPHIFDPFFSLREGGTGLGLSVVYTLLRQNQARLEVESRVNQGTTFKIEFESAPGPVTGGGNG